MTIRHTDNTDNPDNPDNPVHATVEDFKTSEAWRVFRIQAELIDGVETLRHLGPAVTIFGSARLKPDSLYYRAAEQLGEKLAHAGFSVITGGGPGVMEGANRGCYQKGTQSVGLNIALPFEQLPNNYQDIELSFRYFFVRKLMFAKYAKAFVIFPGGYGTMDELFEGLTLVQTGKMRRFPVVLFGSKYWNGLLTWIRKEMIPTGCLSEKELDFFTLADDPEEVVRLITGFYQDEDATAIVPSRLHPGLT